WQPLRRCTQPGCNRRVKSGKCEEHRRSARQQQDSRRGSSRERGYTRQWEKYRAMYLSKNPLCAHCLEKGIYTPAVVVDHIIPIDGGNDVLFWPEWNHQPLCQACHNQKTKWLDPATKNKRAVGGFREEEERAANRNNWMYDADE
ncbi:HNH endonuclease signature motif containing protein, partial [Escherichia coli]